MSPPAQLSRDSVSTRLALRDEHGTARHLQLLWALMLAGGAPGCADAGTESAFQAGGVGASAGVGAAAASGAAGGTSGGARADGEGGAATGASSASGGASAAGGDAGSEPAGAAASELPLLRGVCWNPVPVGARHPEGLDYAGFAGQDIPLMVELGVNVVRTYEPLLDREVLDALWAAGIRVIDSMYPWGGAEPSVVSERVRAVADHPAILMYTVGNEWNYNGLYVGLSHEDALARVAEAARLIHAEDTRHPVATVYGELPSAETIAALSDIDVWGINAYRGMSFGDLFDRWRDLSDTPMFIAEYGADAYNANVPGYDPESQALATDALARELFARATAEQAGARILGGTIFEWADEWWKDEAGSPDAQEVGGVAPGGGPYPDQVFNEEWWGLVDIERVPRPAFESLRGVFADYGPR